MTGAVLRTAKKGPLGEASLPGLRYPEKVQAAETNASAACCSPQNGYKITLSSARRKGFFEADLVKMTQMSDFQAHAWRNFFFLTPEKVAFQR
jgi:hypothetical protein